MPSRPAQPLAGAEHTRQLLAMVQALYAAALQGTAEIWQTIYAQTAQLMESDAGGFISTDKVNQAADIASLIGFDPEVAVQAYREFGVEVDLLFMGTLAMTAGSTFLGTEKIGFRALQRSPFYDVLSRPLDLRYVCGGILENDDQHHSALYFWRRRDQRDFDRATMATLAALLPHVRQALEVQRRVRGTSLDTLAPEALSLASLQGSRHGLFVLDERSRVLFVNAEGERIARQGDGIHVSHGLLRVDDPPGAAEVARMMSNAMAIARDAEFAPMRPIRLPRERAPGTYELLVIPVTDGLQRAILPPGAAFIVALTDSAAAPVPAGRRFQGYGLTGAESRLCEALVRMGSLPQAAEQLRITRSTARSHLKNIFAKVGVSSQVQLVARLASPQGGPC